MFHVLVRWHRRAILGENDCFRLSRGFRRGAGIGERLAQALPHALRLQLIPERHKLPVVLCPLLLAIVEQGENTWS
jgi:hypothetical protein